MKKILILLSLLVLLILSGCSDDLLNNANVVKEEFNQSVGKILEVEITKLAIVRKEGQKYIQMGTEEKVLYLLRKGSEKDTYIFSIVIDLNRDKTQEYNEMTIPELTLTIKTNLLEDLIMIAIQKNFDSN